eukprot:797757-Rhodomonas_salina.1
MGRGPRRSGGGWRGGRPCAQPRPRRCCSPSAPAPCSAPRSPSPTRPPAPGSPAPHASRLAPFPHAPHASAPEKAGAGSGRLCAAVPEARIPQPEGARRAMEPSALSASQAGATTCRQGTASGGSQTTPT